LVSGTNQQGFPAASGGAQLACRGCGAAFPHQQGQQQPPPPPLKRKSLLPPEPPTSAGSSSVDAVFGGVLCSHITCSACGYVSISYEPFLDLSLPIPLDVAPREGGLSRKVGVSQRGSQCRVRVLCPLPGSVQALA
jgi:hypothetical protein